MEKTDREVLLKVDHLKQYFKLGKHELPAVDDVSFEIYKGEVFGLVGESGCGKTTTGRTIIRLYDATGGSVYFDGKRIVAGVRGYKDAIKAAKAEFVAKENALKAELKSGSLDEVSYQEKHNENLNIYKDIVEKKPLDVMDKDITRIYNAMVNSCKFATPIAAKVDHTKFKSHEDLDRYWKVRAESQALHVINRYRDLEKSVSIDAMEKDILDQKKDKIKEKPLQIVSRVIAKRVPNPNRK